MSKKSSKLNQVRKTASPAARTASKTTGGKPANGKPVGMKSHGHNRPTAPAVNYQAVRIVAIVVAVLLLAGAIWASVAGAVTPGGENFVGKIIIMVSVGIIAAFSIFTAVKPEMVSGWVSRLGK